MQLCDLALLGVRSNAVQLDEITVSRHHARLVKEDDKLFIEDLGSYNGVQINGKRISGREQIDTGDRIELGGFLMWLQRDDERDPLAGRTMRISPSDFQK